MASLPDDLVRLPELDAAWAEASAGPRLAAVRRGARRLGDRLRAQGPARCVRTADVATFPYPTGFGFAGAARALAPFAFLRNRVQLVQVEASGRLVTILVNPTDPARSSAAPFFARMIARYGETLSRKVFGAVHADLPSILAAWGVRPEDVDYVTFDHLHVQDLRGLLAPGPTGKAFLPRARLLAQAAELATLAELHPLQRSWYIPEALDGVPADRIVALDGDHALGAGFALIRTPGHTRGNHSPAVVTARGVWTISENGIAVDAYAPMTSRIRGLAHHARETGEEVILNANTREDTLAQYTSMILEKTLADAVPDRPELPQHFPSSELVAHPLAPGLAPTYTHGAITHGEVGQPARPA